MLKDVRIHLDADETRQHELERSLAETVIRNLRRNQAAFKAYIPSLSDYIAQGESQNISIFTNKNGELNILNYSTGRAFYGLSPEAEITAQYQQKAAHCSYCDLTDESEAPQDSDDTIDSLDDLLMYRQWQKQPAIPKSLDVMVVFGIGMGLHIKHLIENHDIRHLVIYEPEPQYFLSSVYAMDWRPLLDLAKQKNTALYFQLNNNGATLLEDMKELREHNDFSGFYLYRHYNHDTFNVLEHAINVLPWGVLNKQGFGQFLRVSRENILPLWSPPVSPEGYEMLKPDGQFNVNIAAFKRYFPDIASEFENYQPSYWLPVSDASHSVNMLSRFSLMPWYSEQPEEDAKTNFDNFTHFPNRDGLVLGYNGVKLKHYHHFQFVAKAEMLMMELEDKGGTLPENIKSLILFGIGPQLSELFEHHDVEKLFICEPNRDFFYASLYSLDWAGILQKVDESGGRLYINVGDDGSHLFRDLINQFYSVGPYILASTYFYQTYYNETMVHTISQLREQLQVVIAMGENFDHARYGIAQTHEAVSRRYPLLCNQPAKKLSYQHKDVPVFIVGNGPSLDNAIEAIKEWQDKAIIVSCGTALMPLYKNGIVPDFHAEIEQNRSTFDWCSRINDFEYLKQVDLLSCNGIHPDTSEIFRNTFVAFKEGESSTVSALNILGRENYAELQFAFPTVSNFALNIFTLMGFHQVYLFGIDLGFADQQKHHSTQSGYYDEQGKEKYKYNEKNNTSIVVPGNFRKTVFTKYEFKVSKVIIERTLAQVKVDCFNTSDGARIEGTKPLATDNILLSVSAEEKQQALAVVKQGAFAPIAEDFDYRQAFAEKYHDDILREQLDSLIELAEEPFTAAKDVEQFTDKQKEALFDAYKSGNSLLFYYLYGTVNHANSALSKILYSTNKDGEQLSYLEQLREVWVETLKGISHAILEEGQVFDHVSNFVPERESVFLKHSIRDFSTQSLLPEEDNKHLVAFLDRVAGKGRYKLNASNDKVLPVGVVNYSSLANDEIKAQVDRWSHALVMIDKHQSLFNLTTEFIEKRVTFIFEHPCLDFQSDIPSYLQGENIYYHPHYKASWTAKSWLLKENALAIIPKVYFVGTGKQLSEPLRAYAEGLLSQFDEFTQFIDFPNYLMVPRKFAQYNEFIVDKLGNRGCLKCKRPEPEILFFEGISEDEARIQIDNYLRRKSLKAL